jgi:hypothetical protein
VRRRPKLYAELRPGTPVVSHAFDMGGWVPDSTAQVEGKTVHLSYMPANLSGTWTFSTGAGAAPQHELKLEQRYQKGYGTLRMNGRTLTVADLRVRGTRATFTVNDGSSPRRYEGELRDNTLTGTRGGAWRAGRSGGSSSISGG